MEINPKLYKLIKKFITREIKGSDVFIHNGSKWLIFEEDKKWVIELTKEGTLWYNYYFFQNIFELVDLDVVENQYYITKWVEDNVINGVKESRALEEWVNSEKIVDKTIQNGVKEIRKQQVASTQIIENTIQNGVKSIKGEYYKEIQKVEYTIQNGVKKSQSAVVGRLTVVEDTIQNGVKDTREMTFHSLLTIEDTIQNGVKETKHNTFEDGLAMEEAIQNGVKKTRRNGDSMNTEAEDAIQNGVKDIKGISDYSLSSEIFKVRCKQTIRDGVKRTELGGKDRKIDEIKDIVENGVKETHPGCDLRIDDKIENTIQNGVKETNKSLRIDGSCVIEDTIQNGVKYTGDRQGNYNLVVEETIQNGVKHTQGSIFDNPTAVKDTIQNGIKETTPGGYLGFVEMKGKTVHQFETAKQLYYVEDVINDGIKETGSIASHRTWKSEEVIQNGVKQCIPSHTPLYNPMDFSVEYRENHRLDDVASVLEKGIKEVQPLPAQDGNMDWGNYYYRQGVPTKPHTKYVDDAIRDGVKETWGYEKQPQMRVNNVINDGIKIK